jgi:hypothetical protein
MMIGSDGVNGVWRTPGGHHRWNVAHVQLAADLLQVDTFSFESESGVATDHEGAVDAREVGGRALCHTIDEIFLTEGRAIQFSLKHGNHRVLLRKGHKVIEISSLRPRSLDQFDLTRLSRCVRLPSRATRQPLR